MTRLFPDKSLRQDGAILGTAPPGSHYNPNQPRVPAGHHDGGQWTSAGGGAVGNDPRVMSDAPPDNDWKPGAQYATGPRPGWVRIRVGERWVEVEAGQAAHLVAAQARAQDAIARVRQLDPSWQPAPSLSASQPQSVEGLIRRYEAEAEQALGRLGELARPLTPLVIPKNRPSTKREQNDIAREVARWLVKNHGHVIEGVSWLLEYEANIEAYLDEPKTLEELQRAAQKPKRGYDIHHIAEQTSAEQDGFPRSKIDSPENLVRIPRFKHWEITGWYMTKNKACGELSPRDYLRGKDWQERIKMGLRALIRHGVLKP
jgi:hypothetical protein